MQHIATSSSTIQSAGPPPERYPWIPDQGDGTFRNPIIFADYSDPDVIRVGDDFYMTASSFNCMPGLPVLHSKDLVNWTLIGHVFQNYPLKEFDSPQHGNGVWAPSLRHRNGEFYVYFAEPDNGVFMSKAKNPAGPWEALLRVREAKGWIDPCPFWDDDGNAYLIHAWAKSRAGINSILTICRMSADGTQLLDDGKMVFDGHQNHPIIEGPKLYKRNGYYYIFAPAGGVVTGWQTVLRSRNVFGPYDDRIVLAHGKSEINGPHQGGWVETQTGEHWFIHFQDRGAYGRIVHLQPVTWVNDWPVIGTDPDSDGKGEPVSAGKKPDVGRNHPIAVPQTSDEFDSPKLGLQWQWHANFQAEWFSLAARPGWLRLISVPMPDRTVNLWPVPNFVLQKLPAAEFTLTTKLNFGQLAAGDKTGLIMMGLDYSYLAVEQTATGCRLIKATCNDAPTGGKEIEEETIPYAGDIVFLRVKVGRGAVCHFSYSSNAKEFASVGKPFNARQGDWIGAKTGLFCLSASRTGKAGHADFDWFRFE